MAKKVGYGEMLRIVLTIALLAATVVGIVGLFISYASLSLGAGGLSAEVGGIKLFDMEGTWGVLTIITAIITVASLVLLLALEIAKLFGVKFNARMLEIILSMVAIVAGFLTFIFGYVYCSQSSTELSEVALAAGGYMVPIAGIIGGICGLIKKGK